tara:strand:+ start:1131 stop:1247 length:117 start_codon:yes stop_codon:yes gene_type:complete
MVKMGTDPTYKEVKMGTDPTYKEVKSETKKGPIGSFFV